MDTNTAAEEDERITLDEVKRTIMSSKNRKASGLDNITNEMLKYRGPSKKL